MGLDCEYPNSCSCGCQDEPRHTGCKCCGRETEHSDDCLIPENARLRAALQKAEAERIWFAKASDVHLERAVEMEQQRTAERARAERYLAAMEPVAYLDSVVWCDIDLDRCRIEIKWSERQAIKALIEGARRAK